MTSDSLAEIQLTSRAAPSRFDTVIEFLFIPLLGFMPFAFGVVDAWSEAIVIAIVGAMALCLSLKLLFRTDLRFTSTHAYIPIVVYILLALLQLAWLPASVVAFLSPQTIQLKKQLLSEFSASSRNLHSLPLSFYPF